RRWPAGRWEQVDSPLKEFVAGADPPPPGSIRPRLHWLTLQRRGVELAFAPVVLARSEFARRESSLPAHRSKPLIVPDAEATDPSSVRTTRRQHESATARL